MEQLKSLLEELKGDDYVRFKYGKRLDAALKAVEARQSLDTTALEARLTEALALLRGQKGGDVASSASKRKKAPAKPKAQPEA